MVFQTHNPRLSDNWTEERIELLLRLDAENFLSRSQIADEMARMTGSKFSRNAIIGKLLRLGAPKKKKKPPQVRPERIRSAGIRSQRQPVERPYIPRPAPAPLPESRGVALLDLSTSDCRYATSPEDAPYAFCGHPVKHDSSYCPAHHFICHDFQPGSPRPTNARRGGSFLKIICAETTLLTETEAVA